MNNPFEASGFQIEITRDGSPTLKLHNGESMHHSGGAAGETWYIYGAVIDSALQILPDSRICTVGLGLGYIEMATAIVSAHVKIDSFEIVSELVTEFKKWIQNEPTPASEIYDLVFNSLIVNRPSEISRIKNTLNGIQFYGDITTSHLKKKWNIICFDAFSKKTSESLWTPEFLDSFLQNHTEPDCIFTTYACTGTLNKALVKHDFILRDRSGFSGKRESTLAVRGKFKK